MSLLTNCGVRLAFVFLQGLAVLLESIYKGNQENTALYHYVIVNI